MPQMAPMWWLNMMIMFIMSMMIMNSMIYFNFSLKKTISLNFISLNYNWKW